MREYPVVSLCITCYNQVAYIRDSVASALCQTYDHLEVIVCDDHSTDGTDKIVEGMLQDYRDDGGRHTVIFKRNHENIGVIKNYEQAFRMAHGELIVTGAGDDVSMPDRVEKIVDAWLKAGRKPTVMFHGLYPMSTDGQVLDYEWWHLTIRNPIGAAMAYSSLIVSDRFPLVSELGAYEDNVFVRRAYAFGDPLYLEEKLIKYRVGSGDTSSGSHARNRQKISRAMIASARQNLIDLSAVEGVASHEKINEIRELVAEIMDSYGVEYGWNPIRKFLCYFRSCKRRAWRWCDKQLFVREFLFQGYPRLFAPLRAVFACAKKVCANRGNGIVHR